MPFAGAVLGFPTFVQVNTGNGHVVVEFRPKVTRLHPLAGAEISSHGGRATADQSRCSQVIVGRLLHQSAFFGF